VGLAVGISISIWGCEISSEAGGEDGADSVGGDAANGGEDAMADVENRAVGGTYAGMDGVIQGVANAVDV
jgi:hypothetical protein